MFELLIGMLMGFLLFFLLIGLILYILNGIGLMGIAKNMGIKNGWIAWVPIVNFALIGKIAFNNIIVQIALPALVILGGSYEATVNGETVMKGAILPSPLNDAANFAFVVLFLVCIYKIYKKLSNKAVIMLIFSILTFGLLIPIFLFAIRNNPVIGDNTNTPSVNNNPQMSNKPPVMSDVSVVNTPTIPTNSEPPVQNNQQ
jgi:hypothetical protein